MAIATRRRAGRPSDHPGHPASACWSCATGIWPSSASQPSRSARARETPRADRPDRAATHRRRLPIRQVQHLGQHERRPPIRVQPPHQPPNTPLSRVHGRLGLREPGSRRLTAEQEPHPRTPAERSPAATSGRLRRHETPATPPRPQKDLLGDVLGLVTIDQMGAHPPHLRLATPDERRQGQTVTITGSQQQPGQLIHHTASLVARCSDGPARASLDRQVDGRAHAHDRTARSLHPAMSASAAAGAAR